MSETLNTLYRLFAPLIVVVVIIAGVNLSSNLIKNAKERQTATSIAYAAGCVSGKPLQSQRDPKNPGKFLPTPCVETTPGGPVSGFSDPATGCCHGSKWGSAKSAAGGKELMGLLKALAGLLKPKPPKPPKPPEPPKTPDNRPPAPVCKSLSVSPTLPLKPGDNATLTWTLSGGKPDTVVVTPGVGAVTGFSTKVTPRSSTTYTVTATNERGSSTCNKVRVYVGPQDSKDENAVTKGNTVSNSGGVDVFSDSSSSGNTHGSGHSVYDDIFSDNIPTQDDNATQQEKSNEGEDYYDFLSTLAKSDESEVVEPTQPADYSDYYYGDSDGEGLDFSNFNGEEPSWDNIDLQGNDIGEADANSLELGMREDNYNNYSDD